MTVASGLQAALLFARGRPEGLELIDGGLDGARQSFWAAAICAPALLALRLMAWVLDGLPAHPAEALALDTLVYVVGWAGFAVLSVYLAELMERGARWPAFITAWNWCNVAQYGLMLAASLPAVLGVPAWIDEVLWIVAIFWSLWLEWFAARLTLAVSPLAAAALVGTDLFLGLFLSGLADMLAPGLR